MKFLCFGCQADIGLSQIPFCQTCLQQIDPDAAREQEIGKALRGLRGAKDHMKNSAGACVSWCPACRAEAIVTPPLTQ